MLRPWQICCVKTGLLITVMFALPGCASLLPQSKVTSDQAYNQAAQSSPLREELTEQQAFEFTLALVEQSLDSGSYEQIEANLLRLRRTAPSDPRVYRLLVEVYSRDQRFDLAYVTAKQLKDLPSATLDDTALFASIALRLEDYAEAEEVYQAWLSSSQSHTRVAGYNNLGFSSLLQKQWDRAERYFNQALDIDPLNQRARHNLMLLLTLKAQR
ncbi:tetratricopeptide repeat protein [Thiomicrospira microaerophila]|uniref:tetratricopeptide repeat protein n=1 Tax=Thiomicrospira microaerophila TaxID=406020 RepID=UPI00200CE743|nr:tetratricopeptide repeat protein [Thiomicrospira microaerophila]UQB43070.1 tetratricopeptide repeat protein [Thiomicrospira microaerophila]